VSSRDEAVSAFRKFASREGEPDLFEGALAISQVVNPAEDLGEARSLVAELSRRVAERRHSVRRPIDALRQVLFEEEGFAGDEETYDDPGNSSIARVLATRRGMPITLSIVVLEVGRRAGLSLEGVGLPGHFVVGGEDLPAGEYLDPFAGGEFQDAEELEERVSGIFGGPVELPPEIFAPDPPRAILARVLSNLRASCERRGLGDETRAAIECLEALDPTGAARSRLPAPHDATPSAERRTFTLDEARALLPKVRALTEEAAARYSRFGEGGIETEEARHQVVQDWARQITELGAEIKGLWLVDFDSGAGYYCWKYPEAGLGHFHGYEEGFSGRVPLQ
jgi:regulator of sirC expression with transglutaminase-like and TPR domain